MATNKLTSRCPVHLSQFWNIQPTPFANHSNQLHLYIHISISISKLPLLRMCEGHQNLKALKFALWKFYTFAPESLKLVNIVFDLRARKTRSGMWASVNPNVFHVQLLLARALDQLLWQRALDPRVMRCKTADITVNCIAPSSHHGVWNISDLVLHMRLQGPSCVGMSKPRHYYFVWLSGKYWTA